ncbi:MAG: BamA/TamA family outer membrane protein [Planctomycetes bacterium]|nr:BamA/TamA family outer membrane protein [Planctomycetota bacterium]
MHDNVVRRILDEEGFVPGALYNAEIARGDGTGELEKTVQRLVMTETTEIAATDIRDVVAGETVDIADSQDGSVMLAGQRDCEVTISESQTGSVMLGAGVASNSGVMGQLVFNQRNFNIFDTPESFGEFITGKAFKGAGQHFRASFSPGTQQSSYSVSFTEPYLYGKPVSLDTALSGFERFQEANDEKRTKFYAGIEKRYKNDWRRGTSFRLENVNISDIDFDAPKEIKEVRGDNQLLGVRLYINKRTTNSRFLPSKGYNFDAGYEQVAGDYTFGVANATQRWYKTLYEDLGGRKTVLETKVRGAAIIGSAPMFEKFYGGGTGSIRGFDYRGVSTRGLPTNSTSTIKDDPIGSDWIITANAEVAVPLTSEALSWLFFIDTGVIDTGGPRASIGTGIQILIPQWFGPVPMRFEIATPIAKDEADDTRVFSFSVGALF